MPDDISVLLAAEAARGPQFDAAIKARLAWLSIARQNQIGPFHDQTWKVWLIISGRGWGKNLSASHAVWWELFQAPGTVCAAISPTSNDLLRYVFEGESGYCAVIPPEILKGASLENAYVKSPYPHIEFANGSRIEGYTAEKPDRLRGGNFGLAHCLVGDTLVTMADGAAKRLDAIRPGDFVLTRAGARRVRAAGITDPAARVLLVRTRTQTLLGTTSHLVYVANRGFVPLGTLAVGDRLCTLEQSNTKATVISFGGTVITYASDRAKLPRDYCIGKFGKRPTGQSPLAIMFITSTATASTIVSQIWKRSPPVLTYAFTCLGSQTRRLRSTFASRLLRLSAALGINTNAWSAAADLYRSIYTRAVFAARSARTNLGGTHLRGIGALAFCAANNTLLLNAFKDFVPKGATSAPEIAATSQAQRSGGAGTLAPNARESFYLAASMPDSAGAPALSSSTASIISVESYPTLAPVYDLQVEGEPEFFANGILVHNCDELAAWQRLNDTWSNMMFALRKGANPRVIVSTTPRPKTFIRDLVNNPTTIISRGTTFENRANLAPSFMAEVTRLYEGTKIGRQELHGEILNPEESGAIKRSEIQMWPVFKPDGTLNKLPRFELIVISLDTAFSQKSLDRETGEADPTACQVWGVFMMPDQKPRDLFGRIVHPPMNVMLLDAWQEWLRFPELVQRVLKARDVEYGAVDESLIQPMIGGQAIRGSGRKADQIIIEDKGSGISLRQTLEGAGIAAYAYNPGNADKLMRLHVVSHIFTNGLVWVPEGVLINPATKAPVGHTGKFAKWAEPAIEQWCTFAGDGSIEHDDHVDALSQALRVLANNGVLQPIKRPELGPEEGTYARAPAARWENPYAA